jgi:hypothetical protein
VLRQEQEGETVGHHRFIPVTLAMDVADPAAEGTPDTPDDQIKAGLIAAITGFKPKIKNKDSQIKNVKSVP